MSFCPFCTYTGANDLSYLNHITIAHYNTSYECRKCLKQAFVSSSTLHNHKKVCLGFDKKPSKGSDSKPSSGGGVTTAKVAAPQGQHPRSMLQRLQPPTPRAQASLQPHRQPRTTADATGPIAPSPTRTPSPTKTHRETRKRRTH